MIRRAIHFVGRHPLLGTFPGIVALGLYAGLAYIAARLSGWRPLR